MFPINIKKIFFVLFFFLFHLTFLYPQWQLIGLNGEDVRKIQLHPKDSQIIFAGSANVGSSSMGGFFVSNDSGSSWDTLSTLISVTDFVIDYQNPNIIYVALSLSSPTGPGIIKTTDGGNNWFSSGSGIEVNWETGLNPIAIDPINPNILYCGTQGHMGGDLYKTTNGGLNWFKPSADTILFDIGVAVIEFDKYNPVLLYIGRAMNGTLFRSTDGGVNFEFAGYENGGAIKNLKFGRNSDEMYVTSSWSFNYPVGIFRTIDGGIIWQNIGQGFIGWVGVLDVEVNFSDQDYIYICTFAWEDTSGVYIKINESSWQNIGLSELFINTLLIKDNLLYAETNEGVNARDLVTNVEEEEYTHREKSFVMYPIYPNPFKNITQLKYVLIKPAKVKIEIIDILGNSLIVLANEYQYQGEYTIKWNGQDKNGNYVSSGVYLIKFQIDNELIIQKIISLK